MSCAIHDHREPVGVCTECGRSLCGECVSLINPPTCAHCAIKWSEEVQSKLTGKIVLSVVLGIAGFFLVLSFFGTSIGAAMIAAIMLIGLPWGFKTTPIATGGAFATQGCLFGVVFFLGKLIGAAIAGIFVMPFQIIKMSENIKIGKAASVLLQESAVVLPN